MVRRDFHHEGGNFTGQHHALDQKARDDGGNDADHIDAEHQILAIGREERRCKQHVDRHAGAAAHEGSHHDGDDAVGCLIHRAGGHNGRHVAAKAHDQRYESFAGKSQRAHYAVHHERGTSHVTRVLKHGEEQEQEEDRRNKGRNRRNTAADTVGEQNLKPFGRADCLKQATETVDKDAGKRDVEEVDESAAEVLRKEEHHVHDRQEDRQSQPTVQDHAIDLVGHGVAHFAVTNQCLLRDAVDKVVASVGNHDIGITVIGGIHIVNDLLDLGVGFGRKLVFNARSTFNELQRKPFGTFHAFFAQSLSNRLTSLFDTIFERNIHRRQLRILQKFRNRLLKFTHTLLARCDQSHNRATERLLQCLQIHLNLVVLGNVEHIDSHDHRNAHFNELRRQVKVSFQVGGINDVDHSLRFIRKDVVAGDAFVFAGSRSRRNGINAGKVNDLNVVAFKAVTASFLIDGDARPVADFLFGARQSIKKRRFAAIRIADNTDDIFHFAIPNSIQAHFHNGGFVLSNADKAAANANLNRIAQRSHAHHLKCSSRCCTEHQQTPTVFRRLFVIADNRSLGSGRKFL